MRNTIFFFQINDKQFKCNFFELLMPRIILNGACKIFFKTINSCKCRQLWMSYALRNLIKLTRMNSCVPFTF